MRDSRQHNRRTFWQPALLGSATIAGLVGTTALLLARATGANCTNSASLPLFLSTGFSGLVIGIGAASFGSQWMATQKFLRSLSVKPLSRGVCKIESDLPLCFCAGFLFPKVYVSQGTLERLSPAEVEAVLSHERHHAARRDPLRMAILKSLRHALFFLPVMKELEERFHCAKEVGADEQATRRPEGREALVSALLKLSDVRVQMPKAPTFASLCPFASPSLLTIRVQSLAGKTWRHARLTLAAVSVSIVSLLAIFSAILPWTPTARAAPAPCPSPTPEASRPVNLWNVSTEPAAPAESPPETVWTTHTD